MSTYARAHSSRVERCAIVYSLEGGVARLHEEAWPRVLRCQQMLGCASCRVVCESLTGSWRHQQMRVSPAWCRGVPVACLWGGTTQVSPPTSPSKKERTEDGERVEMRDSGGMCNVCSSHVPTFRAAWCRGEAGTFGLDGGCKTHLRTGCRTHLRLRHQSAFRLGYHLYPF